MEPEGAVGVVKARVKPLEGAGALTSEACRGQVYMVDALALLEILEELERGGGGELPRNCVLLVEPPARERVRGVLGWGR
jgi:hypothetical protein